MAIAKAFGIAGDNAFADLLLTEEFKGDLKGLCDRAISESGLHVVTEVQGTLEDGTEVIAAVLSESSAIIVRRPNGHISISIYTCGKEGKPGPAVDIFCEAFPGATVQRNQIVRGNVPITGISARQRADNAPAMLAIADNLYKGKVSDNRACTMLRGAVSRVADISKAISVRKDFKPQGMTQIIVALDKNGNVIILDAHTYPENVRNTRSGQTMTRPYISISVSGEKGSVRTVMQNLRCQDMHLAAANQPTFPRLAMA